MRHNPRLLLYLIIPLICAMRDPFEPVTDSCQTAQLSLWRYRGMVQSGERWIGIMQNGEGKWHRVEQGKRLSTGWMVNEVAHDHLTIDAGAGCEPRRWQWKREGTQNVNKDKSADAGDRATTESGKKRYAGG